MRRVTEAALEKFIERWRLVHTAEPMKIALDLRDSHQEYADKDREIERLRGALLRHGQHIIGEGEFCGKLVSGDRDCTCGLDKALQPAPPCEGGKHE